MWMLNYSYQEFTKKVKKHWFVKYREWKWSHEMRYNFDLEQSFVIPRHDKMSKLVVKNFIKLIKSNPKDFQKE